MDRDQVSQPQTSTYGSFKLLIPCSTGIGSSPSPGLGKGRRRRRGVFAVHSGRRGKGRRAGELKTAAEIVKQRCKRERMKAQEQKRKRRKQSSAGGVHKRVGKRS